MRNVITLFFLFFSFFYRFNDVLIASKIFLVGKKFNASVTGVDLRSSAHESGAQSTLLLIRLNCLYR